MNYDFEEVSVKGTKVWTEEGKKKQKTKKFSQTLNPFNRNEFGQQKSRSEVMKEITTEKNKWINS